MLLAFQKSYVEGRKVVSCVWKALEQVPGASCNLELSDRNASISNWDESKSVGRAAGTQVRDMELSLLEVTVSPRNTGYMKLNVP